MPTVSVIVPNYNHAAYLQGRINSILQQTYTDFELILLDDCSTDNSRDILESFRHHPKVSHVVYNAINSGTTFKQWNKGIGLAKGKYIWLAESDDNCEAALLEKAVAQMEAHLTAGIVYVQSLEVDELTKKKFLSFSDHPRFCSTFLHSYFNRGTKEIAEKMIFENTIPNASAVVFKKNIYEQCGGPDESMRLCGDWLLWTKMLMISDVVFIAEPLNYFRLTHTSVRNRYNIRNSLWERLKVLSFIKSNGIYKEIEGVEMSLMRMFINTYKLSEWKEAAAELKHQSTKNIERIGSKIVLVFLLSLYDRLINKRKMLSYRWIKLNRSN